MRRPFRSIVKQSPVGRMAVYSSCEALQVICDSYIDESSCLQCRLRRCIPDDYATQIEKCWVSSGKKEITCCNVFGKFWLVSLSVVPVVLSVVVVNQEQVPASFHSRESTEPIVIPEPAKLLKMQMKGLKDADERIFPHAIWPVQHGCQRLVVMSNDTVMRLLHFTYTLVRGNLKNL